MSLATRCTSCGTIFRVVQDQLKVSDGWVRCGRCNEVFNAMEGLFDLQRDAPHRLRPHASGESGSSRTSAPAPEATRPPRSSGAGSQTPVPAPARPARSAPTAATAPEDETSSAVMAKVMRELATQEHGAIARGQAAAAGHKGQGPLPPVPRRAREQWPDPEEEGVSILPSDDLHPAFADAEFPDDAAAGGRVTDTLPATEPGQLESQSPRIITTRTPAAPRHSKRRSSRSSRSSSEAPAQPGFVQRAALRARWRRPWVRMVLALCVFTFAVLLAMQAAYQWRDRLAAQWPQTRPALTWLCTYAHCQLQPPQAIEAIVVESTTLSRNEALSDGYRLTVVLRNRAVYEVRQPHLDLSLTDADGSVVARRAIAPTEFRLTSSALPPQSETTLQLALVIEGHRVAGYTVAAFYP